MQIRFIKNSEKLFKIFEKMGKNVFQLTIVVLPKFLSKNFFFLKFTQTVFFSSRAH